MPDIISDQHFNKSETIDIDGTPYVNGGSVVWLDTDDGLYKRHLMDKGVLVLQYWDVNQWKNV